MQEKFPASNLEDAPGYVFGPSLWTFTGPKGPRVQVGASNPPWLHKTYHRVQQDQATDGGRPLGDSHPGGLTVLKLMCHCPAFSHQPRRGAQSKQLLVLVRQLGIP